MRLRTKHIIIQTDKARITEQQIVIFQRLSQPKTFHLVRVTRLRLHDVVNARMAPIGAGVGANALEHFPALVAPLPVASDPVHDKDGFDGFGSVK
jgi:hypothetical protein